MSLDIIIPVHNDTDNLLKTLKLIKLNVKTKCRIYICYDSFKDDVLKKKKKILKTKLKISFLKNSSTGPCKAVITGLLKSKSDCKIVYMADDFCNTKIIDKMFKIYKKGYDIVAPSRFMKNGSMIGCPIIKYFLIRIASFSLHLFSSIPIQDASNGFRLFSKKLLKKINIQSKKGFCYSLEILVKCNRLGMPITQVPSVWKERIHGESRFKVFKWIKHYLVWYFYGLQTSWFRKKYVK